jgi:predicted lipoprotein with Yx(FWY)xxD motif
MTRRRPITFLASAAVIPLVALAVAACGDGGAATAAAPKPAPSKPAPSKPATTIVRVANSHLGQILVDSKGLTLYLFKADVGTKSECSGGCASAWPPLLATGNPSAGTGVTASKLGTTTRSDGTKQVTYNGHPLYLYIGDTKPGETTGQDLTAFGAAWFVVSPAGNQIPPPSAAKPAPKPAPPPAAAPAPKPAPPPAAAPAPKPAPPPAAAPAPPANGIPQNGGGDDDGDNHGAPSDGDGNI